MSVKTQSQKTKLVPPDGGWGWVVLISALTVNLLIPGTVKSFGVLFVQFVEVFKASPTAASWMPAMCYFLYSSLGPLSSILSTKYSYRTVTVIGGACAAVGMMSSYFANSVSYLYISYGLMVGIGAGLTFPPTVYIVTAYFLRLRGFANGLCISGSAIGTIILPPFLQYLLDNYGYRGAVLIMGAITLNTIVCGLLYHPLEQHMVRVPVIPEEGFHNDAMTMDEPAVTTRIESETSHNAKESRPVEDKLEENDSKDAKKESIRCQSPKQVMEESIISNGLNTSQTSITILQKADHSEQGDVEQKREDVIFSESLASSEKKIKASKFYKNLCYLTKSSRRKEKMSKETVNKKEISKEKELKVAEKKFTFDLSILKDPVYLVILISNSTSAISNTNFMILLPSYAIAEGFDKNMAAFLLSIVSILDLIGRIGGASLSDINFIPKYYYFVGGLGTSGIALALLPMATTYTMLSFFCGLFGLSSGVYIGITTVVLADMLGPEKLSSSYGISLFVNGVLQLIGPPICGVVFEYIGSYKPIFLAFGIILILGTSLWAALPIIKKSQQKEVDLA